MVFFVIFVSFVLKSTPRFSIEIFHTKSFSHTERYVNKGHKEKNISNLKMCLVFFVFFVSFV